MSSSKNKGFIVLYRGILEWEWYSDLKVRVLFLHCLLMANWEDKNWEGQVIKRGSFVTSRSILAKETGLTVQQLRTALDKLISTNELTRSTTNKYTVITVTNYDKYQNYNHVDNQQTTNKQPTNNQQITTTKQINKITSKQDNDYDNDNSADALEFDEHHFLTKGLLIKKFLSREDELFSYDALFEELSRTENAQSLMQAIEYVKAQMKDKCIKNKFGYFKTAMLNQLDYIPQEATEVKHIEQPEDVQDDISDEELRALLKSV